VETICGQANGCMHMSALCFVHDFQTLLTGVLAIIVAVFAGVPVWRQLKDTNLQTRISHRETLATLLRDALARYEKVYQSIDKPLSMASDATSDPIGEPSEIDAHDAHGVEQMFRGAMDWYLVTLADTEHPDIESQKRALRAALDRLTDTLHDAHWADHNDQHDEDHAFSNDEWTAILARCKEAKAEASARVSDVQSAYRALSQAQEAWAQSLRNSIAKLDLQIAAAR
jgi:hypothetical protein